MADVPDLQAWLSPVRPLRAGRFVPVAATSPLSCTRHNRTRRSAISVGACSALHCAAGCCVCSDANGTRDGYETARRFPRRLTGCCKEDDRREEEPVVDLVEELEGDEKGNAGEEHRNDKEAVVVDVKVEAANELVEEAEAREEGDEGEEVRDNDEAVCEDSVEEEEAAKTCIGARSKRGREGCG